MGGDKQVEIKDGALRLPAETVSRLADTGQPLRLAFNTPRLLAIVAGGPIVPEGTEGHAALAGDLSRIPPPDLFGLLTMTQKSGVLRLLSNQGARSVFFERGEIVFASTDADEDRLGNFLYRRGLIEKKQLREAEKQTTPGTRFGKVLVELGYLEPKQLWEAVRTQIEEVVYSIFNLHEGEFVFVEGDALLPDDLSGYSLSSQNLLMEGIRRSDEMSVIEELVPNDDVVPRRRDSIPQAELSEMEQRLLNLIDNRRNVRQIMRASKRGDFEVKRALYDLAKAQFIDIAAPGEAGSARDPKARMRGAITDYNKIFSQLYQDLKQYAQKIDVDHTLQDFFSDLSNSRFAVVFDGIDVSGAGQLDAEKVMDNLKKLEQGGGATLAIAGLNELLHYELLIDALNEFLNFEIFTVRNVCADAQANDIIKKIRQIQSGLMS